MSSGFFPICSALQMIGNWNQSFIHVCLCKMNTTKKRGIEVTGIVLQLFSVDNSANKEPHFTFITSKNTVHFQVAN